jgi:hypothetical protein
MSGLDPRPIGWFAVARASEVSRREIRGVLAAREYSLRRRADGEITFDGAISALREQNGFVLAWHHPHDRPPSFEVPVLDEAGWRPLRHTLLRAHTHPQVVYENSIDVAHFPVIHGYTDIAVRQPMRLSGHEMSVGYAIARGPARAEFEVHLHGLGVAHNHIVVPAFGLRVRMFALATPTTPGEVEIRLGVSVHKQTVLRPFLPFVHLGVQRSIVNDFRQDMAVWESKRFLRPPLLVKGDGPIEAFRRFCRQFSLAEVSP